MAATFDLVTIPADFAADDWGSVLIVAEDCRAAVFWAKATDKQRLRCRFVAENYPSFDVQLLSEEQSTDEAVAAYILDNYDGWTIRKNNLNVPIGDADDDGVLMVGFVKDGEGKIEVGD